MHRRAFLALLPAPFVARFLPLPRIIRIRARGRFTIPTVTATPSGVVARKLYRTDALGSTYKLIATAAANDSAWTYID